MSLNNMQKYVQEKNLPLIFDLSVDYFRDRKKQGIFLKDVHYIVPPSTSRTKKPVLWIVPAVEEWLWGNGEFIKTKDEELENLLKRR